MPKMIFFAFITLTLVSLSVSQLSCSDKFIIDSNKKLIGSATSDVTNAYNGPASCEKLKLNGGYACCYIKIKFKNEDIDEKFTHKGCYEITDSDGKNYILGDNVDFDFDDVIVGGIKTAFDTVNTSPKLSYKSVSVDCNSKYLQIVGLALLFLLL